MAASDIQFVRDRVLDLEAPIHNIRRCVALLSCVAMGPSSVDPEALAPLVETMAPAIGNLIADYEAIDDATRVLVEATREARR